MRRRLTPIERVMWTLGQVLPVAIAVTARVHGHCDRTRLTAALGAQLRRHPMLAVRITDVGLMNASITTEDVPEPELVIVDGTAGGIGVADATNVADATGAGWRVAVAQELRRPFDASTGPFTRFVLVDHGDRFDLAVVCHHLVCDGLSLAYVLRDIVARLADPALPAGEVAAPPMHELVRALPRPPKEPKEPKGERFDQPGSSWPVRPRTQGADYAVLSLVMDAAEGIELQRRCRAERTSVHAALGVAALRVLADLDGGTLRQIFSPVNLRPLLPSLPEGACGNYALELFTWFDTTDDTGFWAATRRLRQTLNRQTAPDRLLRQVRLLSLTGALPNTALSRLLRVSCKPYSSFTFSNLGRVPFPTSHGEYRIESMHGAINMGTLSSGLLAAITVDDRICLSMSTTASDRPTAEQTMTAMLGRLRAALSEPD